MTRWSSYKMDRKRQCEPLLLPVPCPPTQSHQSPPETQFNPGILFQLRKPGTRYSDFLKSHSGQCFQSNIFFLSISKTFLASSACLNLIARWSKIERSATRKLPRKWRSLLQLSLSTQLEWETCIFPPSIIYVHRPFRMEWRFRVWWAFKPTYCWIGTKAYSKSQPNILETHSFDVILPEPF